MSNITRTQTTRSGSFRLLGPATGPAAPGNWSIELAGRHWSVTEPDAGDIPAYTCVSYAWGLGKVANPLAQGQAMSDRAIPAIEAAIGAQAALAAQAGTEQLSAFWLDAFCVPPREPARTACLRSMGWVYGRAARVVVVLSRAS